MKSYTITVNGNVYDVTVEENAGGAVSTPKAAPVSAGAAGKVFKLEASVGQKVAKGDPVIIIEAMKMEIPVVAPEDGTVASIDVAVGDSVEAGAVMATLN